MNAPTVRTAAGQEATNLTAPTRLQKCGLIQTLFTQQHMFKLLQFKTLGEINTQLQQQQPETIKMAFQGVRAFQAFTEKTSIVL